VLDRTRSSVSSTSRFASASFYASRARSTAPRPVHPRPRHLRAWELILRIVWEPVITSGRFTCVCVCAGEEPRPRRCDVCDHRNKHRIDGAVSFAVVPIRLNAWSESGRRNRQESVACCMTSRWMVASHQTFVRDQSLSSVDV